MTTEEKADVEISKGISEIVGALTDPIIVYPGGWGDSLPDWLKSTITLERLVMNMRALKGGGMTGTDAEACAYLFTASLTFPLDRDWTEIYLHIAKEVYEKFRTKESGVTFPKDIRVDLITDDQMRDLNRLKAWLYQRRTTARQDRDRFERRQKRKEAANRKELLQPKLFDF